MPHAPSSDVSQLLRELADAAGLPSPTEPCQESFLVEEGRYVGRVFRLAGLKAVWRLGQPWLDVFDADNRRLRRLPAPAADPPTSRAA